jgi:NADPH-dependent 2,4-dienoyl-CoA reductase/sulfur reductase-like enzyme
VSGEVPDHSDLPHRTLADLEATGMRLLLDHRAEVIEPTDHLVRGLDALRPAEGVHVLHSMDDTLALTRYLAEHDVTQAMIIGGGYIGLEMAEALTTRGLQVTLLEQLPQLLARTLDPELVRPLLHQSSDCTALLLGKARGKG